MSIRNWLATINSPWLVVLVILVGLTTVLIALQLRVLANQIKTPYSAAVQPIRLQCQNFISQEAAQFYMDNNPAAGKKLDGDHDGKACESLK